MSPHRTWFLLLVGLLLLPATGRPLTAAQTDVVIPVYPDGWRASPPTADCAGPIDAAGRRWYEPAFDDSGWLPVKMPDASVPAGQHRFYRNVFAFLLTQPQAALRLTSQAGSLAYVNGEYVGRWGSDCDAPQAVAGSAEVDLTPFLNTGANVLAVQVDAGPAGGRLDAHVRTGAGKVWTVYRGNPVVDVRLSGNWDAGSVDSPSVLKEADGYRMWYVGSVGSAQSIGLALSKDGITWHAVGDQPVLRPGASGEWDSQGVSSPSVVHTPDGYLMVYAGSDGQQERIGLATSPDGVQWTKYPGPVLKLGGEGSFDSKGHSSPALHYDGRRLRLWYVGTDGQGRQRVGLALSADGIHWFKNLANPVLEATDGYGETSIDQMSVVQAPAGWEMWYSTENRIFRLSSPDGVHWTADPVDPVLTPGAQRSWTSRGVSSPSVLFDGVSYSMWYAGIATWPYGDGTRIGVAISSDGIRWKERSSAVLEQRPGLGSYEEWTLGRACVLPEPDGYHMWYSGHYTGWRIQEAFSQDGINWEREDNNVALWPGPAWWDAAEVFNPRVLRINEGDGALLHMWYSGWDRGPSYRIGHAVSTDGGKTWVKSSANPVLDIGPAGAWDSRSVQGASVVDEGDGFRAWYMGQDGAKWQIGMATSPDGDHWTKYGGNPVLSPGPAGAWDGRHIFWLHVIKGGPGYQMWYSGTNDGAGVGPIHIGYAESADGIHWNRDAENPVSMPRPQGWWGQSYPAEPYVLREGNLYRMWYTERMDAQLYRLNYAWSAIPTQPFDQTSVYMPLVLTLP